MRESRPGWQRVRFGDIVRLGKERSADPVAEGIERFVGLEHLEPGDLRIRSWGDVADGITFTTRFRAGHVLFGKRRAYQRKVGVADFDGVCSGDLYVFEPIDPTRLLPGLLPYICQTDAFFNYAVGTSAGSLSPRTNWTSLAEYEFVLPSPEEQRIILAELQAASQMETALRSLYDALGSGQLALSEHFATGRSCRMSANGSPAEGALPDGWTSRTVDWLATGGEATGVAIGPFGSDLLISDYDKLDSGTPVLFVGDIRRNEFVYESHRYISVEKHRELAAHEARGGDVVCNKTGWPPGVTARLPVDWPPSVITSHLVRIRLNSSRMDPDYFAAIMNSHWGQVQCVRLAPGTTRPQMTLTGYRALRIAVPPMVEQKGFVERFGALASCRNATRERIAAARKLLRAVSAARLGG